MKGRSLAVAVAAMVASCASEKLAAPAKVISNDASAFSATLSSLQDDLTDYEGAVHARTTGTLARADAAQANARERQVEWQLLDAHSTLDAFDVLSAQAHSEAERVDAPALPPASSPKVELPVKPIAAVASGLDGIGKGESRLKEIKELIDYGRRVNSQLSALDDKAGTKSAAK